MFPEISTIDDIWPAVEGKPGILRLQRDEFTVIDYVINTPEIFDSPLALECRGIKFDRQGWLIARPFHKFFNAGEKEDPKTINWNRPHNVLEKRDGSMVHPWRDPSGRLRFMTRKGLSEQGEAAERIADSAVRALCQDMLAAGFTALFEYTAPENRIVLFYDRPALTLLAVRDNRSGEYMRRKELEILAARYQVPLVRAVGHVGEIRSFLARTRDEEGREGYVVAFDNGERFKVKTLYYALRHKALAGLSQDRNLLELIARDGLDDVLPLLPDELRASADDCRRRVLAAVERHFQEIGGFVSGQAAETRKDFAAKVQAELHPRLQPVAFAMRDGRDGRDALIAVLLRACTSGKLLDEIRTLFGFRWTPGSALVDGG